MASVDLATEPAIDSATELVRAFPLGLFGFALTRALDISLV
jgi:hypothetical protein